VPGFGSGVTLPMAMPALNFVATPAAVVGVSLLRTEQPKKAMLIGWGGDQSV